LDRLKRSFFITAGSISLGIGFIGIFLPLLPTTPFILLAAACYYKGSKSLNQWLLNNRLFGSFVRNYMERKGISVRSKIFALAFLWATISYTTLVVNLFIIQIILFIIAVAVSIHIITLPTHRNVN
jgi:uncharacterized membrane protein YbaN (DUF454 family)